MKYNKLGRSGLKVSELSFGSWLTFGPTHDTSSVKKCMRRAFDLGINFFDNAEAYAKGQSEVLMGDAIKDFRREDLVLTTKIYWGGNGPNDTGTSWKRLVEGSKNSLKRLKVEYVDVIYCHRYDPTTPIDETVRAMDQIIRSGHAFYWGTSEWPAEQIEEAYKIASLLNCIPPTAEQPEYNMFERKKVEDSYLSLYKDYGLGLTTWSPLASGILTGKYNNGIPKNSRLSQHEWLRQELSSEKIEKVKKLQAISNELDCSLAQLSIAWCLKNPHVNTVILGATSVDQLEENIRAVDVKNRISDETMQRIERLLQ